MRRRLTAFLPLVFLGCAPPSAMPSASGVPQGASPKPLFAGMRIAVRNRSPWRVEIEPMTALRVGGSNSFGPPEETQPGTTKVASTATLGGFFSGGDDTTARPYNQGDAMLVHLTASPFGEGAPLKEAYVVLPRSVFERTSEIEVKVDTPGVSFSGSELGFTGWMPYRG